VVCGRHRATCAEEPAVLFAADEVEACPVCGKSVCASHRATCAYCGRRVCTADLRQQGRRCATCSQLAAVSDPPESIVAAALAATGRRRAPTSSRRWRMARDRSHLVVELDLGWKQKAVFTVRHGENVPDTVVKHSLLKSLRNAR